MGRWLLALKGIVFMLTTAGQTSSTNTAFHPGELWPDDNGVHINAHGGGILLDHGVFYWFGEHKIAGNAGNTAHVGVHVYASKDLYNWTDKDIALKVSNDLESDITEGCVIERPKVVYCARTRKYVMWFHLELKGKGYEAARVGVATSDRAAGPYTFLSSFRLNAGKWPRDIAEVETHGALARDFAGGQMSRDMTLYVDTDGVAYHIGASEDNSTLHISRLTDDFLGCTGEYVRALPGKFNEAPAIMKHGSKYYMFSSDCTGWAPNPARLAVADHIMGPWTPLDNPCVGTDEQKKNTFESQSTYVLPVPGKKDAFIFMADRWRPHDALDGRYIWLPIQFRDGVLFIAWMDRWDLSVFEG